VAAAVAVCALGPDATTVPRWLFRASMSLSSFPLPLPTSTPIATATGSSTRNSAAQRDAADPGSGCGPLATGAATVRLRRVLDPK
jgi:hypothetical protein